ncbi:MAG: hypothetical protein LBJ18_02860 [Rickettsiales bacterium]|jgi:hypothetical protein|nr:hypothetical protein [Rickettsiales bacterium]
MNLLRFVFLTLFALPLALSAANVARPYASVATASTTPVATDFVSVPAYQYMQPFMNGRMQNNLNPGVSTSSQTPASAYARTSPSGRSVVARPGVGAARVASSAAVASGAARSALSAAGSNRRVVARGNNVAVRSARGDDSYYNNNLNYADANNIVGFVNDAAPVSSARCLADYAECMNGYCQREKTAYNRCYCSAKLAQIDSEYQPAIDGLIRQILEIKGGGTYTQDEMNEYWENTIGQYTGDNSWLKLDSALDINWADMESRVRGQQAFATGHDYCSQHLRGCFYMAGNLRDAYRSDIARDCASYETQLLKIKNAAEAVIENYRE